MNQDYVLVINKRFFAGQKVSLFVKPYECIGIITYWPINTCCSNRQILVEIGPRDCKWFIMAKLKPLIEEDRNRYIWLGNNLVSKEDVLGEDPRKAWRHGKFLKG